MPIKSMDLKPGTTLSKRYYILNQLGQGGFGKTFLAEDIYVPGKTKCVVKQLSPQSTDEPTLGAARRLFATEAKILYDLGNHPQIPQLLAYFEEDQEFYLVQEYIEGHELGQEIGQLFLRKNEKQVITLLEEILEILVFIHQNHVIHRDINPRNILRRKKDNKLVLIDFGAVKQLTTQILKNGKTLTTIGIGTPGYFPSEQSHGNPKFSSDIYASGIIALQALTGLPPEKIPTDSETGEICWHHLVSVSEEFRDVLDCMIRYDYRQRYPSAMEALQALKNLSNNGYQNTVNIQQNTNNNNNNNQGQPKEKKSALVKLLMGLIVIGIGAAGFWGVNAWLSLNNAENLSNKGRTLAELNRYEEALQAYNQSLENKPEYAPSWKGKGDVLQVLNRYQESLDAYDQAIQIQPNDFQSWIGRGQTLKKLGKYSEATEALTKAIELRADSEAAWQELGLIQLKLNQYAQAVNSLDKSLQINPNNESVWYQKGWALQNLREYDSAIEAYDQAVKIKPDLNQAWYQKANTLMNLNKYQDAVDSYDKAVQFEPKLYQAWYSKGIALNYLGRYEEALNSFKKASEIKPEYYDAWSNQAWNLHNLKRYQEAINAYTKAAQLQPSNYQAWYGKGNSLYNLGEYEQAMTAYQKTVSLKKDYYPAWKSLGHSFLKLKRYQQAINAYEQALRYQPDDKESQEGKKQAQTMLESKSQL